MVMMRDASGPRDGAMARAVKGSRRYGPCGGAATSERVGARDVMCGDARRWRDEPNRRKIWFPRPGRAEIWEI